jgi:hypothetical protein
MRNARHLLAFSALLFLALLLAGPASTQTAGTPPQIPGLTAKDTFPRACVDCHVVTGEGDMRISTLVAAWKQAVDADLLAKAKAANPGGAALRGKHPTAGDSLANIPDGCAAKCHKADSKLAPPMAQMMHNIHLTGGAENKFLTQFQGQCTHCHKLDATGDWKVPSGPEKK